MFEREFFMRETQLLAQAVGNVITKKKKKQYDEALEDAEKALSQFFKTDTHTLRSRTSDEIIEMCMENGSFFNEKGLPLADLLMEEGDIMDDLDKREAAIGWYQKSLSLYQAAVKNTDSVLPLDIYTRINHLKNCINDLKREG